MKEQSNGDQDQPPSLSRLELGLVKVDTRTEYQVQSGNLRKPYPKRIMKTINVKRIVLDIENNFDAKPSVIGAPAYRKYFSSLPLNLKPTVELIWREPIKMLRQLM